MLNPHQWIHKDKVVSGFRFLCFGSGGGKLKFTYETDIRVMPSVRSTFRRARCEASCCSAQPCRTQAPYCCPLRKMWIYFTKSAPVGVWGVSGEEFYLLTRAAESQRKPCKRKTFSQYLRDESRWISFDYSPDSCCVGLELLRVRSRFRRDHLESKATWSRMNSPLSHV